jgi:hypothetical protein
MDLLTTCTHHSELQVITTLSLIFALHKSPQHLLSLFQPAISSPAVPWQLLLTVEILQLMHSAPLFTAARAELLPTIKSTIAPSLLSLPCRAQLNSQPSTKWNAPIVFFINPRRGPHQKHCSSIVSCLFISAGTCLPIRCSETANCLFVYCITTAVLIVCFEVFA